MSIAEEIPYLSPLSEPAGRVVEGTSFRDRSYRLRGEGTALSVHEVLRLRGLVADTDRFLSPRIDRDLPDPSVLADMDKAARRLADAIQWGDPIVIFGDYDVDGASASAVLGRWLRAVGVEASIYIPDRLTEGYGPSDSAFGRILQSDVKLIVCVDCGTASFGPITTAVEAGVDVLVVDHHKPQGNLPPAMAVVNPHRVDCTSGLTMMCAAALAFMLAVATQRELRSRNYFSDDEPKLRDLLDIVALATVADVVPLIGPSRMLVAKGLEVMLGNPSPGVKALMDCSRVERPTAGRLGFALGPRINAGGRIGSGSVDAEEGALGVKLLMATDEAEAARLAVRLDAMNGERQSVEAVCLERAMEMAAEQVAEGRKSIAIFSDGWHPGIVGIVASRVKEKYDRPTIIGGRIDDLIKASGRSMRGFDLGAVVVEAKARGLLGAGGGHAMACGLSCNSAQWQDFVDFLEKRTVYDAEPLAIDMEITAEMISISGVESLEALQPLGMGMPAVCIAISGLVVEGVREMGKDGVHAKLSMRHAGGAIDGLWWRAGTENFMDRLKGLQGRKIVAIGTPGINEYMGRKSVQMDLSDLIAV